MSAYKAAYFVVTTLKERGYIAYFAGGWVRDFLLNHSSDDIDIATNAPPEIIQSLFLRTVPIGISFGIVLVIIDGWQFEVATFRKDIDYKDGRHPSRIEYATPQEDAKRRDFTINGMFYDPIKDEILDYVDGKKDLESHIIRAIGNAEERIIEDRLRMIRAIRLASKLNFTIEENTKKAIIKHATDLFPSVAIERIWQELIKMAETSNFKRGLMALFEYNLLQVIFPSLANISSQEIEKRLIILNDIPPSSPLIVKILELFPQSSPEKGIDLCKYLKLSNKEIQFVSFLFKAKDLMLLSAANKTKNIDWAYFYADKRSKICLDIIKAHIIKDKKEMFEQEHRKRRKKLEKAIFRIRKNDPVIKSKHLIQLGIKPGKTMGILLKEGEKIAINEKIEDPKIVLDKLQQKYPQLF